jgi:hypothetical protein
MIKRLTEAHPLMKKYRLLEEFLTENDISISHNGYGLRILSNGIEAHIRDSESGDCVDDLPYLIETKLTLVE